jgi:hypothetical protein
MTLPANSPVCGRHGRAYKLGTMCPDCLVLVTEYEALMTVRPTPKGTGYKKTANE